MFGIDFDKIQKILQAIQIFLAILVIIGAIGYMAGFWESIFIKYGGVNIGKISAYGLPIVIFIYIAVRNVE